MDKCLHCAVLDTVTQWFSEHGTKSTDGRPIIDVVVAIEKLTDVVAEISQFPEDRSERRRAFRFAHDALDGNLKSLRTGKSVLVNIPLEH